MKTKCNGCGKQIQEGDDSVRVSTGKLRREDFDERKEWGLFHQSCFNRSIDSPNAVLDEMKRQARTSR